MSSENFIKKNIGKFERIEKLAGDASARLYSRIFSGDKTYILCKDNELQKIESYTFKKINNLFQKYKINIPEILSIDEKESLLILNDLGNESLLENCSNKDENYILGIYKRIIDQLIKIQSIKGDDEIPFNISFDVEKLIFEFDFFIEYGLLNFFDSKINNKDINNLRKIFLDISEYLYQPNLFVLNHRDFHSKNIMIFNDFPYIIDFQDARMGLPQYDIVSFLRDSYFKLADNSYHILKDYYYENSLNAKIHSMKRDEFDRYFNFMAFQRNIKAIGTFSFQSVVKKNSNYEKYIQGTFLYLDEYSKKESILNSALKILKENINKNYFSREIK
jgi:N-acetylmuramate 1-kinase